MTKIASSFRYLGLRLLALACVGALPSCAATLQVTNTNDSGPGSLRQTIATANSGDTIGFAMGLTGTVTLTTGEIAINQILTIEGPGPSHLSVSGGGTRVFNVGSNAAVTISGLGIKDGYTADMGGGILNNGTLVVANCSFSNNHADSAAGGAIASFGNARVTRSTFNGNSAAVVGGAILASVGQLVVENSTFVSNHQGFGQPGEGSGGAIFVDTAHAVVTNSTVVGNSSDGDGSIAGWPGAITVQSTVLAQNVDRGGNLLNCPSSYTFTSAGYNLSDDSSCGAFFNQPTDKNNTPAQLDPKGLQDNGGPTQTVALLPASPAVDAIPVAACTDTNNNPVKTDQRGITRPQGKDCDIGAYELVQAVPFASFHPALIIDTGKKPGFILTSTFTLGSASSGLNPASEAFTLQIANYTLTLPAGSFHQLWSGPNAPFGYEGTVNGSTLVLGLIPLGNNTYSFNAAGSPVTFPGITNPVTVTLTFGNDTGTRSVKALLTNY